MNAPLIDIKHATILRSGGEVVFRDLNWAIRDGETWAIVGPVGSGKTSLAEALAGRLRVEGGSIAWPFIEQLRASGRIINWPSEVVQRVSFKEESRLFSYSHHYYQQRFNFIEPDDDLTLDAFLRSSVEATDAELHADCERLGIETLRDLSLIKLSNGQTRRARIARALLSKPEMLILDEPFMGLDVAGRSEVATILGTLIEHGTRVLLITRPEAIPDWVTHVLELDRLAVRRSFSLSPALRGEGRGEGKERVLQMSEVLATASLPLTPTLSPAKPGEREKKPVIEMRNVNVSYGKPILQNVTWTVDQGERWAVLGPNGSGKTTLLSLICGDHPQAYSNDIYLFGRKRGSGETIWEVKRNVGLVSPELHLYFSEPLSAFRTAATGFFDVLAYRRTTPEQDAIIHELFAHFEIASLAERPFARLSTGEQRLVLLIRSLVKSPPLLILDEPFQGLDGRIVQRVRAWLDEKLRPDQTLLFVSHIPEEIPDSVNRRLRLENGVIVENV